MSDSSLLSTLPWFEVLDIGRLFCHSYNIMVGYGNFEGEEEGGDKNRASLYLELAICLGPTWAWAKIWLGFSTSPFYLSRNQSMKIVQGFSLWDPPLLNYSLSVFFLRWEAEKFCSDYHTLQNNLSMLQILPISLRIQIFWKSSQEKATSQSVSIVKSIPWLTDQWQGWMT